MRDERSRTATLESELLRQGCDQSQLAAWLIDIAKTGREIEYAVPTDEDLAANPDAEPVPKRIRDSPQSRLRAIQLIAEIFAGELDNPDAPKPIRDPEAGRMSVASILGVGRAEAAAAVMSAAREAAPGTMIPVTEQEAKDVPVLLAAEKRRKGKK